MSPAEAVKAGLPAELAMYHHWLRPACRMTTGLFRVVAAGLMISDAPSPIRAEAAVNERVPEVLNTPPAGKFTDPPDAMVRTDPPCSLIMRPEYVGIIH